MRAVVLLLFATTLVGLVTLATGAVAQSPRATAGAQVLAGLAAANAPAASARGDRERSDGGAVDSAGVRMRSSSATAEARASDGTARASAVARSVTLLDGRVTAFGVRRTVEARDGSRSYAGSVEGLRVDGRLFESVTRPRRFQLDGGAGTVSVNRGGTGLELTLVTDAGGLPAGTKLRIASVRASADAGAAPTPAPTPTPTATATPAPTATATPEPTPDATRAPKRRRAPSVQTRLTRSGFAFPIYPPSAARVADSYGGARPAPIVSHQGVDIFAKFGSPVVAVADGRLSKVGTLPISGNRLWLTTDGGDAFFYAHMASFSEDAVSGRRVKAGTVLGFTGNTGDAEPTPPHVHFEIHPGGIDAPPVDPYPIVMAWRDRDDVPPGAFLRREGADTTTRPGSLVAVRDFIAE